VYITVATSMRTLALENNLIKPKKPRLQHPDARRHGRIRTSKLTRTIAYPKGLRGPQAAQGWQRAYYGPVLSGERAIDW